MPREYQLKRKNPYRIENSNTYRETLYIIMDYRNLLEQRKQILSSSPAPPDGMPRGSGVSDPTFQKAAVLSVVETKLHAIEQTIFYLKGKYADTYSGEEFDAYESFLDYGVFCYFRSRPDRDLAPSERTWRYYRSEFVWHVAKKLNFF